MTVKQAYEYFIYKVGQTYENREAENITRIVFEDLFSISNFQSNQKFSKIDQLENVLIRLLDDEPVQYITGMCNFYGYNFKVNRHVLIPRPETEELVHWILSDFRNNKKQFDVLDVGLGSGCIAITLKKKYPRFRVFGIDNNLDTLNVARINSRSLGAEITFYNFDFLDVDFWNALGVFDIIVSNPPYIDRRGRDQMADNVLKYEPEEALFPGPDPLVFYKAIQNFSNKHLRTGSAIYLELNEHYVGEIRNIFEPVGSVEIRKDMQGVDRMLKVIKV